MWKDVFKRFRSMLLVAILFLFPSTASAWTYLGIYGAEIAAPSKMYIDWNAVVDLGDNQFLVKTLNVHANMMMGIDLPDRTGGLVYDMRYPHRSYITTEIYDCERRMIATIRTEYYYGKRPEKDQMVFDQVEEDPVFFGDIPGLPMKHPALDAVCAPKPLQEFELLG